MIMKKKTPCKMCGDIFVKINNKQTCSTVCSKKARDAYEYNRKETQSEYVTKYHKTEKGKAARKKYEQSEKSKETTRRYERTKKRLEYMKKYLTKYHKTEKGKAVRKKYEQSEKSKAAREKYYLSHNEHIKAYNRFNKDKKCEYRYEQFYDEHVKQYIKIKKYEKWQKRNRENNNFLRHNFRHEVLMKCNWRCVECGMGNVALQLDHMTSKHDGGILTMANSQMLCQSCNINKSHNSWMGGPKYCVLFTAFEFISCNGVIMRHKRGLQFLERNINYDY